MELLYRCFVLVLMFILLCFDFNLSGFYCILFVGWTVKPTTTNLTSIESSILNVNELWSASMDITVWSEWCKYSLHSGED